MTLTADQLSLSETFLTQKELANIRQSVEQQFPYDPALQEVYIARKILKQEAEQLGLDYLSYIKQVAGQVQNAL